MRLTLLSCVCFVLSLLNCSHEECVYKNPPGRGGHAWGRDAKIGPYGRDVPPRSSLGGICLIP